MNEKIFTMDVRENKCVVGLANGQVIIFDVRKMDAPEQIRNTPLKLQTRTIKIFPNAEGYAIAGIEGRVGIEYLDMAPALQQKKYVFKCHRIVKDGVDNIYPVNCLAFHSKYGTFATGGCDGFVNVWDGANRKRLFQYKKYPTSISSLAFNYDNSLLAIASSYTWENGDIPHPPDQIFIRPINDIEVHPRMPASTAGGSGGGDAPPVYPFATSTVPLPLPYANVAASAAPLTSSSSSSSTGLGAGAIGGAAAGASAALSAPPTAGAGQPLPPLPLGLPGFPPQGLPGQPPLGGAGAPPLPFPPLPNFPGLLPNFSGLPPLGGLPGLPPLGFPPLPGMAGLPGLQGFPGMPGLPGLPGMPPFGGGGGGGGGFPNFPNLPMPGGSQPFNQFLPPGMQQGKN